jgi:hypothetical protein
MISHSLLGPCGPTQTSRQRSFVLDRLPVVELADHRALDRMSVR